MDYLHFLLLIPAGLALVGLFLAHTSAWTYLARAARRLDSSSWTPSISIVVPVRGVEQDAERNFGSLLRQAYSGEYEVIFAVEDQDDPAVPLIEESLRRHGDTSSRLVLGGARESAASGKLRNLIAGFGASRGAVAVFVDSDVHAPPTFLQDVAASIADPAIGLAFAAPVCEGAADIAAALHNLLVNSSWLQYASSAQRDRLNAGNGAVMAMRREVVEQIGGLEMVANRVVGIDISISRAVRGAGYRIQLLRQPARMTHARDTLGQLWWQMHRWLVTIRSYYPVFPLLMVLGAFPMVWSLLFLAVALARGRYAALGAGLILLVLAAHVASAALINARLVRDARMWRCLWLAPLTELFQLPVFIYSLLTDRVLWRGRWVRVARQGAGERGAMNEER
jgi:ceramide glucosyltransferase